MQQLFVFFLALCVVNLLFVILQALVFKAARFPIEQIGLGIPVVFKRRVNGVELKIGILPTLAFVYSSAWLSAPRGKRALTALAPWLAIACVPLLLIEPARALRYGLMMWPRLLAGALDTERAHALISRFWQLFSSDRIEAFALAVAFVVALNLAPVPGLAGGHVLLALLGARLEDRLAKIVTAVTWGLWFLLFGSWLLKLASFLAR